MKRNLVVWAASCVVAAGLLVGNVSAQDSKSAGTTPNGNAAAQPTDTSSDNSGKNSGQNSGGSPDGNSATSSVSSPASKPADPSAAKPAIAISSTANPVTAQPMVGNPVTAKPKAVISAEPAAGGVPAVPPLVTALNNAKDLYRSWKLKESLDAYNAILKSDPNIPMAYVGMARVYLKQKNPADAYVAASKALEMSPSLVQAHVAMGEVYFRQGKLDDANREFTEMVKSGVNDARAYLGLAHIYFINSYFRHGVILIDRAHELDPDDPDIRQQWIFTLSRKERIAELHKYLDVEEDEDEDDRGHLGKSLKEMEDAEEEGRACHAVGNVDHAEIPLQMLLSSPQRPARAVGLKVHMGGATATLMVDTGAHGILVDRGVAEKAGVRRVVETDVGGIGDKKRTNGYMGVVSSIKVGDVEFADCDVFVADQRSVVGDDGLIGADVFRRFLVDIDIPRGKLVLSQLPPEPPLTADDVAMTAMAPFANAARLRDRYVAPEMKGYTQIVRIAHEMLIPVRINKGPIRMFMIDTGSFGNSISPTVARDVTKVHENSDVRVTGLSGNVKNVFLADNVMLQFSKYYQKANDVVSFDTTHISDNAGTEITGFLGFSMLRMLDIKIDYRDGLVDFYYKQ